MPEERPTLHLGLPLINVSSGGWGAGGSVIAEQCLLTVIDSHLSLAIGSGFASPASVGRWSQWRALGTKRGTDHTLLTHSSF